MSIPTATRNLDPRQFFIQQSQANRPKHSFATNPTQDFSQWKIHALPEVLKTLGNTPTSCPANPQLISQWQEDQLIKERWLIDVQDGLSAVVLIYRPAEIADGKQLPAILCCHGHGDFGKDTIMGLAINDEQAQDIRAHHSDYGLQLAKSGFVTYSFDFMGFGERDPRRKPAYFAGYWERDACNVNYLCASLLGMSVLGSNLHDASVITDFVCQQAYVDSANLGVIGLSYGGTVSTWMMLYDDRFKASSVSCYVGPFHAIGFERYDICGSQITNGLYQLVDVADLHGLIAPKPLLLEVALQDRVFEIDAVIQQHLPELKAIYDAAGASEQLTIDLFEGDHRWHGKITADFFRQHLT
ncbi:MAG: hypothetical protein CMJ19_15855 [Phycisphaeraceae bacterium]|nr:hypothetical protein [Phycisphaeraceae bacterium]